ncbi:hypothetical protein HPB51_015835 [Rhipicephalus microplus]|uniref:Uncharacterized protein n=1 Tax=Rhipicephalus microplus TaxID=6941 RepID=A0A9J6F4G3_RHIMP|nr:hypothetical protein HPB51_015835 [Rhipicephalus microplus]
MNQLLQTSWRAEPQEFRVALSRSYDLALHAFARVVHGMLVPSVENRQQDAAGAGTGEPEYIRQVDGCRSTMCRWQGEYLGGKLDETIDPCMDFYKLRVSQPLVSSRHPRSHALQSLRGGTTHVGTVVFGISNRMVYCRHVMNMPKFSQQQGRFLSCHRAFDQV